MFQNEVLIQSMDLAMEMIIFFLENGQIIYANRLAYQLLEYQDELTRENICAIYPKVFDGTVYPLPIKETEFGIVHDTLAYRKNHTCFDVNMKYMPVKGHDGVYMSMALDASKQNYFEKRVTALDAEADSAQKVKTQFVANITHELRTPVNGILGNVRELLKIENDNKKLNLLHLMERGCNDMHSIINGILDFSKLEAGKLELEKKEFVFRDMMEYIKSNHINKIAEKGLQFFMTVSKDVPETIIGDELRIGQILNNLLSNAVKFTSIGKITVEVVKTAQLKNRIELFFMVIDSGIGIAAGDLDKLFKSFSQVEASTTRKYGGTGLGLNISKQLVEMMDGNIHVESEPNKGTMFSFHIWVDVPGAEVDDAADRPVSYEVKVPSISDLQDQKKCYQYGTDENMDELQKKASRLILSVEMENWEKAEHFMDAIKQLTQTAPQEIRSATLRLKMAVQKADYDKTQDAYQKFCELALPEE